MNYKKNVISVILWLLSVIMAGTGAMMVTMPSAPEEAQWIGLVITGVWLAVTGLVAFLLSRGLQKSREKKANVDNPQTALVVEGILTVLLVAVGIVLRIREIQLMDLDVAAKNVWFDTARVTTQTQIPQVVHGAVYLYLQMLHGLLLLLGNKITVALGFQAGLQILGWVLCYFAVRSHGAGLWNALAAVLEGSGAGTRRTLSDVVDDRLMSGGGSTGCFSSKGRTEGHPPDSRFFYRRCGDGGADLSGYHWSATVSSNTFGFCTGDSGRGDCWIFT